ncbi:MAG: transglycosylase SLT domain-containing protein [Cocleimonas sp.]|nr:transglycosylase SLT domain-containing protein [Cocleimonas sp.]
MQKSNIFPFFLLISLLFFTHPVSASESDWDFIIPDEIKKTTRANYAERAHIVFSYFLNESLRSKGKKDFKAVTKRVRNRIFWKKNKRKKNLFVDAYERSYPKVKRYKLPADIPHMILLIPYLESLWQAKAGDPSKDYGYWQLLTSIVKEIKELSTTPDYLKKFSINKLRSRHKLSTKIALIHLKRYYFYFRHVVKVSKTDAWLFSIVAYNWGSGNVRRMLRKMKRKKITLNFSNFYHYLYSKHKVDKDNKSLRTAVEYLPHLWNIAQVIRVKKPSSKPK